MTEIFADVEQGIARNVGGGVRKTVTEVERSLVPPAAETRVGVASGVPLRLAERHHSDTQFANQVSDFAMARFFSTGVEHDRGLRERRRSHPDRLGFENPIHEREIAGL